MTSGFSRGYELCFIGEKKTDRAVLKQEVQATAAGHGLALEDEIDYTYIAANAYQVENVLQVEGKPYDNAGWKKLYLMTLDEYNRLEKVSETLQPDEVLFFSSGPDFSYESVSFEETEYAVKEELTKSRFAKKYINNTMNAKYLVVLANQEELSRVSEIYHVDADTQESYYYGFWVDRMEETSIDEGIFAQDLDDTIDSFSAEIGQYAQRLTGYAAYRDRRESMENEEAMYGGLLFIGIFFGSIFLVCLLIIMYYKQITEGFEDQKNFDIMQNVGMGDEEIRSTIRKQIRMVFGLPLIGALCHTAVGMQMVYILLGAIGFFETSLLIACTLGGCLVFALVYSICYKRTSMAYYRIVRKME